MENRERFIVNIENIIQDDEDYNIFCLNISHIQSLYYTYGLKNGDLFIIALEKFLKSLNEVVLYKQIYTDMYFVLVQVENHIDIVEGFHKYIDAFVYQQEQYYPASQIEMRCGSCMVNKNVIIESLDGAYFACQIAIEHESKDIVVFDHYMKERLDMQRKMELQLQRDLMLENFCIYLQPVIDIRNGQIMSVEAFVRRIDDEKVLRPESFLPYMERNGWVIQLDMLVCRLVCQYIEKRIKNHLDVFKVSMNLSSLHVEHDDSAYMLHSIIQKYQIPAELIEFEIHESMLFEHLDKTRCFIDELRGYGYRVCIDHFGSSNMSLNPTARMVFDSLKIDPQYVNESYDGKMVISSICKIAQRLNIDVICCGVENNQQFMYLKQIGCFYMQGYEFSKEMSIGEFDKYYQNNQVFIEDKNDNTLKKI